MCRAQVESLNSIYKPLNDYKSKLIHQLRLNGKHCEWGYYSGHFIRGGNDWLEEYYPIPVVSIAGIGDIGLDLEHIFIEGKMKREEALTFDFKMLEGYKFEVYGILNYLEDFYRKEMGVEAINKRILETEEKEIGISFFITYEEPIEVVLQVVNLLERIKLKQ